VTTGGVLDVPLDRHTRLWLAAVNVLRAIHVYPTMERMPSIPLAKRKASKPHRWLTRPLPPDVKIEDRTGLSVGARIYRSEAANDPRPIVLFTHGGGFVNGGLDAMQFLCAHIAAAARVVVVSVDYPLAPESPFPAALEASYEWLCWAAEHGGELGGDPDRLSVMGDSAGGNLAAALCLLARRKRGPAIDRQILIYPTLDATLNTPRMQSETAKRRRECEAFYGYYTGDHDRRAELISPLLASDVANLPPATIITAQHDSLRDDGVLYAARLAEAGVPVRHTDYLGMPHGFLSMPRICRAAPQALAEIAQALDPLTDGAPLDRTLPEAFGRPSPPTSDLRPNPDRGERS
jgi:acetyl esterase/lipase